MSSRRTLFRVLYQLGFTPWDGHPISESLQTLVEGDQSLTPGRALDIGCGTGDSAIYLAQHGWRVTAIDFVPKALAKAKAKADASKVSVDFRQADATRLSHEDVGSEFGLILDNGCMHGMDGADRESYVRELAGAASPGAHLVIVAFTSAGGSSRVRGIEQDEITRRFTSGWTQVSTGDEPHRSGGLRYYVLRRQN
jgi:SAM-dependent methyltransferase